MPSNDEQPVKVIEEADKANDATSTDSGAEPNGHEDHVVVAVVPTKTQLPTAEDPNYRWFVLGSVLTAVLLVSTQGSALIIAFPDLMVSLNASLYAILWVLLAYMVVISALVALFGGLSVILGRKRTFNWGFATFTVGTLLCGFSQPKYNGIRLLTIAEVFQGIGAASLFSNSSAIMTDAFIPYNQVGLAMGGLMVASAFGSIIGPLIGGALHSNWVWIFFIMVPLGSIGTGIAFWKLRDLPKDGDVTIAKRLQNFDWIGSGLLFSGLCIFLVALTAQAIPNLLTQAESAVFFVIGGILLISLVVFDLKWRDRPVIEFRIFQSREFSVSQFGTLLTSLCRFVVLFTSLFFFQGPYAFDPFMTGVLTMPFGGGVLLVGLWAGKLADRYGPQIMQVVGPIISGAGCLALGFLTGQSSLASPLVCLFVVGGGLGLYLSPNSMAGMVAVSKENRGSASGVTSMLVMTGQVLSLQTIFGILTSSVPFEALMELFLYGGGGSGMDLITAALHKCFYFACALSWTASLVHLLFNFVIPKPPSTKPQETPQK